MKKFKYSGILLKYIFLPIVGRMKTFASCLMLLAVVSNFIAIPKLHSFLNETKLSFCFLIQINFCCCEWRWLLTFSVFLQLEALLFSSIFNILDSCLFIFSEKQTQTTKSIFQFFIWSLEYTIYYVARYCMYPRSCIPLCV